MSSVTTERVRAALEAVKGPDGRSLVAAGQVAEVELDGAAVTVVLRFEGLSRDARHALEDAAQSAVEGIEGVGEVTLDVQVIGDPMVDAAPAAGTTRGHVHGPGCNHDHDHDHGQGHAHAAPKPSQAVEAQPTKGSGGGKATNPLPGVKNLIAIASGKGGVGKSTVAVNLALALKARGAKVGLLDVDVYGPSAPLLLGVAEARPGATQNNKFLPVDAYGLKVMSIGFLLDADQPGIWRGPIVGSIVKQFLTDVDWGDLDYLCIDLPPGTGDAHLSLTQTAPITGAIIVTTPSELALIDAVKGLQMFRKVDTPVIGIVENMSHYACPKCEHESQPFNSGGTDRVAAQYDARVLARIPIDIDIQRGGDEGRPVTATKPDSPQARAFLGLADSVIASCPFDKPEEKKKAGFLASLFKR